jgi:hypothetical protein
VLIPERSSVRTRGTDLESDQVYPLGRFQVVFTGIRARLEPSAIIGKAGMDLTKLWVRHQTMTPKLVSLSLQQEEGCEG